MLWMTFKLHDIFHVKPTEICFYRHKWLLISTKLWTEYGLTGRLSSQSSATEETAYILYNHSIN